MKKKKIIVIIIVLNLLFNLSVSTVFAMAQEIEEKGNIEAVEEISDEDENVEELDEKGEIGNEAGIDEEKEVEGEGVEEEDI